jgi:hypothetical protein
MLPTGVDLNKICYSIDTSVQYPCALTEYNSGKQRCLRDPLPAMELWSIFHKNIYYVHPTLLAAAEYFFKFKYFLFQYEIKF